MIDAERSPLSGTEDSLVSRRSGLRWTVLAALEIVVVTVLVILDYFIPTLIILPLVATSLAVRRQRPSTLGFRRSPRAVQMSATVLGLTAVLGPFPDRPHDHLEPRYR